MTDDKMETPTPSIDLAVNMDQKYRMVGRIASEIRKVFLGFGFLYEKRSSFLYASTVTSREREKGKMQKEKRIVPLGQRGHGVQSARADVSRLKRKKKTHL